MQLRRGLPTALTVLSSTAILAVCAFAAATSNCESSQVPASSEQQQPTPSIGSISSYEGLKVRKIRFLGISNPGDAQRFREILLQHEDAPLDRDRLRQSIQALYSSKRFADIRVDAEREEDGVVLSFVTEPNYFVGAVDVEGLPNRPSPGQVANASKFQLGELFTVEKLERALKNIKQLMEESGYYRHSINVEQNRHPEIQQIDLLFRIDPGPQAHVGQVRVTGNEGYSQGQIQDIGRLHPGDFVSSQRVTQALDRVRKKYQKQSRWLAEATIAERTYHAESNTVDYTMNLAPGPTVEIVTEGFNISPGILKKNVPVYQESALDDDLLNEGRRNLLNYLQGRGYFEAKVGLRRQRASGGKELRVIYVIDAGARHKLVKLELTGNKYFADDLLRAHLQILAAGRFLSRGRYSQKMLADDISGLEDLYRANGFREVKITSEVEDDYQGVENQLAVTLHMEEGPQTRVGSLQIVGNHLLSEEQLRENISTLEGQPFSEFYIAQDREVVLSYYFNRGFPEATFEASAKPASGEPNRMDVTFTIQEGREIFVNQVLVSGLNFTRPYVVQRELQVKPGDPVSQIEMLRTQQNLYDLGVFSQVDTAVQNPEGEERDKNVLVQIQEAKRYTFNYGLGLEFQTGQPAVGSNQSQGETGVSPRVSFGVTRLNFKGRNHTIAFKAHVGRLQQRGLVSYEAPRWFSSPRLRFTVTAFYDNTLDVTTFTSQRLEGSVQIDHILGRLNRARSDTLRYQFTYRRVQATNVAVSPDQIPLLSQPVRVGMPGLSYIRDRRDNPLDPTKGSYSTLDTGLASKYFGSEADFSRILIQNSTYHAFGKNRPAERKFIFARSTRVGVESAFANTINLAPGEVIPPERTVIPLPERFFSGGGNSHRGFGLNQAGPRDPLSGFPLGGSALFVNNLELRMPAVTLPFVQDNISFALFHDAGNVFVNGDDMIHNLLRWRQKDPQLCHQESTAARCDYSYISQAVGVGIRYKTPIGPVRFDLGYNLNPPAFPSTQTTTDPNNPDQTINTFVPQQARHFNVFFSIGQTF